MIVEILNVDNPSIVSHVWPLGFGVHQMQVTGICMKVMINNLRSIVTYPLFNNHRLSFEHR